MDNSREIVNTRDVRKTYTIGNETIHALAGITVTFFAGEYISIMGPSGSGKTTFFNMIGGLDKPTSGEVYIDKVDIDQLDIYELAWLRCLKIGYIFQTFNLIPVMTALENVTLPMIFAGLNPNEAKNKGSGLLDLVGLGDRFDHRPTQLSGGQQQRVAIARSLANDPAIILADEPTGNLDLKTGRAIIDLLTQLKEDRGVTIITATHDMKMVDISDRVVSITDGNISSIQFRDELDIKVGAIEGSETG